MTANSSPSLDLAQLVDGVRAGDRRVLGQAITLIESHAVEKRTQAEELLEALHTGEESHADRIGITGVPGVGKSTFIDALGTHLTASGRRVAVLAVDPTSPITGGSILGDKTRMARLARDPQAFIRPSPSSGTLGGVAARTRETMLLVEAAGFDVVLVETVGVGQSETVVEEMVDFFLVLMLAGAGDELQGIKRGILEVADLIAVNKADGDNLEAARRARAEYQGALQILRAKDKHWAPTAVCVSAKEGTGLAELWVTVEEHQQRLRDGGQLGKRRSEQLGRWMWQEVGDGLQRALERDPGTQVLARDLEQRVRAGQTLATRAAREVLEAFLGRDSRS
jgi:LAO/AO transport system kinase